jgi:hypothetical protein
MIDSSGKKKKEVCNQALRRVDNVRQDFSRVASHVDQRVDDLQHNAQNFANNLSVRFDELRQDTFRHDVTDILRTNMTNCVSSFNQLTESFAGNTHLLTNSLLGLAACVALCLLLWFSDLLWMTFRLFIWCVLGFLCYRMIYTYLQHSQLLSASFSCSSSMSRNHQVRFCITSRKIRRKTGTIDR